MMRAPSISAALLVIAVIGSTIGCGGSDSSKPAAAANAKQPASAAELIVGTEGVPQEPIARVVYEFLDAMRRGDSTGVSQRLTPLALERAKETDSPILPPGSPTARFKVGNSEQIAADKAVVDSVWTDLDVDGKPNDEPMLWALRLCDGQWRVSGLMVDMGPNAEPVTINFEDPESMTPQKPASNQNLVGSGTTSSPGQPAGAVARNPFDQASQR